jgi:hypothetical protein
VQEGSPVTGQPGLALDPSCSTPRARCIGVSLLNEAAFQLPVTAHGTCPVQAPPDWMGLLAMIAHSSWVLLLHDVFIVVF